MLRLLALIILVYGMALGLHDGWLVVRWSLLLHNIGFTQVEPDKPINWPEFIFNSFQKDQQSN